MFSVRTKIIMRVKLTSTLLRQGACVRGGSIISVFVQRLRSKTWTYESNVFFLILYPILRAFNCLVSGSASGILLIQDRTPGMQVVMVDMRGVVVVVMVFVVL